MQKNRLVFFLNENIGLALHIESRSHKKIINLWSDHRLLSYWSMPCHNIIVLPICNGASKALHTTNQIQFFFSIN